MNIESEESEMNKDSQSLKVAGRVIGALARVAGSAHAQQMPDLPKTAVEVVGPKVGPMREAWA